MKKFINEYKALRSKSETETSKNKNAGKVESPPEMGVFKWLRRERLTVSISSDVIQSQESQSATVAPADAGTIRTEEYKRDLAEFQARRSLNKDVPEDICKPELPVTPVKKKCGRHSLPVSCTKCASPPDNTFNYEKKSAAKYKKKTHKRAKSVADENTYGGLPNIQFLFQNQVFMPGVTGSFLSPYPEPQRVKKQHRKTHRSPDFDAQKQIEFNDSNEQESSPTPIFYKNNSLPVDSKYFLDGSKCECDVEEVDGAKVRVSSHSSGDESISKVKSVDKGKGSDERLWEAMSELKNLDKWADEQLQGHGSTRSDDNKSDISAFGLPVACASNLDVEANQDKIWKKGKWGVVPVQIKKLAGVNINHVREKRNTEINILRKFRHPNIILLMGFYPDVQNNTHIICEQCVDSLYGILHIQGRLLSAQSSVGYALDISNALVFLRMQGYVHTALNSQSIMITSHDAAKLADLGPCTRLAKEQPASPKKYDMYSPEPQYVNIEDTRSITTESEPLLSKHPSETYLASNSVCKPYELYRESEMYRWQAPELFDPDEMQLVYPCVKSSVYSLCLILWECCNAAVPWKTLTYEKLKELYKLWKTGIRLPQDGTYPGCLLALLQSGLVLSRAERIDLTTLHSTLANAKCKLDELEYIIIPARKKKSNFSSVAWETNSPTDDSDCLSPIVVQNNHQAMVHKNKNSSPDTSEKDVKSNSNSSPVYETLRKDRQEKQITPEKCYVSDEDRSDERPILKFEHLPERELSSACSTPIAKIRASIKDIGTPNVLHRSDSTEYCSILSPDNRYFAINEDSNKDQSTEKPTAKLSRSFTPKSYKPLHIKVPEFQLENVKPIIKENTTSGTYKFDVRNYSLPTTPIARSNTLRRNAWLSGDLGARERISERLKDLRTPKKDAFIEPKRVQSAPETPAIASNCSSAEKEYKTYDLNQSLGTAERSTGTNCLDRDSFTGLRKVDPPPDFSPETEYSRDTRDRSTSWSYKQERPKYNVEDDVLAKVNVKPLVAIHERWIYEANRKTGRSMSLPEDNRTHITAVKPASHCVDTLQNSLPQLNTKKVPAKPFRTHPVSPGSTKSGNQWENFCQAREAVARNMNFGARDPERFRTWGRDTEKWTSTECSPEPRNEAKVDQATDTQSIEEFVRDLIRKEFQHILHELSDDSSSLAKNDDALNKGVANIIENLKNGEEDKKEINIKSFSRVKINGNNKPLLQITFSRGGENSLQVLDNCVNVTISDSGEGGGGGGGGKDKLNVSLEDTLTADDVQVHALKRCQGFNAIQEARSTEDLYIDDELSTQLQENFGGRVKLIPLHGSLHEILCEREDDCCLLKVKQENGCDTIYFRCDNSDTESRDAIDGPRSAGGALVYKRSISLVQERVERVFPPLPATRSHPAPPPALVTTRALSVSSPCLASEEIQVNIDQAICQDSSSDECIRCRLDAASSCEDFESLERSIDAELTNLTTATGLLGKISEENLSGDASEKEPA